MGVDREGKPELVRTFFRMCRFMGGGLVTYVLLLVAYAACELVIAFGLAYLLRNLFDAVAALNGVLLVSTLIWFGLFLITIATVYPLVSYGIEAIGHGVTGSLRKRLFGHIVKLPVGYFKSTHSGEMISRITNDVALFERAYLEYIPNLFSKGIVVPGAIVYMAILDWRMAVFAVSITALAAAVGTFYARVIEQLGVQVQEGLAIVTSRLSDIIAGAQVIRGFNLQELLLEGFREATGVVRKKALVRVKKEAVLDGLNEVFSGASFLGVLSLGAFFSLKGEITIGTAMAVVQLLNPVSDLFSNGGPMVAGLACSMAAAGRVFEILDTPEEPVILPALVKCEDAGGRSENTEPQYLGPVKQNGQAFSVAGVHAVLGPPAKAYIEFKGVTFGYNPGRSVLVDVSFRVEEGQMVALVGPSGSGKSTVFKLLMGFYAPQKGTILVGGVPIYEQTLADLRRNIAFVPQDSYIFSGTIAENIGYGRPGASMEEIVAAARAANAHDFIVQMEKGYETEVGEKGARLSGGQRQRIAIARAILKDAPILLLDEATSHLDAVSSGLIQDALERLMAGRTTLVIAHQLSTVRKADKIIVLQEGRVVEEGIHEELLAITGGYYKRLYEQGLLQG